MFCDYHITVEEFGLTTSDFMMLRPSAPENKVYSKIKIFMVGLFFLSEFYRKQNLESIYFQNQMFLKFIRHSYEKKKT